MIEANEVNSTFYALRMLSHRLVTSEIQVTDGEEYPASEFTKEEQEEALAIIHRIEDSESASFDQLPPDKIDFHLTSLADRIDELANGDLADAGYAVETAVLIPDEPTQVEDSMTANELSVKMRKRYQKMVDYQKRVVKKRIAAGFDLERVTEYPALQTAESVDLLLDALQSPAILHAFADILRVSPAQLLRRVKTYRSRQRSKTETAARPSAQRSTTRAASRLAHDIDNRT